jgi:hypothetical protein
MKSRTNKVVLWLVMAGLGLVLIPVVCFVVWRVRLANDVERQLAAIRAAGLPTNGKELNSYYLAVPDSENAALVMTQAFALERTFPDSRSNQIASFKMPERKAALTAEQEKLLTDYVELNAAALAKVQEALLLPHSRYPVDYTAGYLTLLPHLAQVKNLAQTARKQAALFSAAGRLVEASVVITNILGMAVTLDDDPSLISQLVRVAIVQIATRAFRNWCGWQSFKSQLALGSVV